MCSKMAPSQQVNAGYYRAEARRIRGEAATVKDAAIRSQLLQIATTYERLEASTRPRRDRRDPARGRTIGQRRPVPRRHGVAAGPTRMCFAACSRGSEAPPVSLEGFG